MTGFKNESDDDTPTPKKGFQGSACFGRQRYVQTQHAAPQSVVVNTLTRECQSATCMLQKIHIPMLLYFYFRMSVDLGVYVLPNSTHVHMHACPYCTHTRDASLACVIKLCVYFVVLSHSAAVSLIMEILWRCSMLFYHIIRSIIFLRMLVSIPLRTSYTRDHQGVSCATSVRHQPPTPLTSRREFSSC